MEEGLKYERTASAQCLIKTMHQYHHHELRWSCPVQGRVVSTACVVVSFCWSVSKCVCFHDYFKCQVCLCTCVCVCRLKVIFIHIPNISKRQAYSCVCMCVCVRVLNYVISNCYLRPEYIKSPHTSILATSPTFRDCDTHTCISTRKH